jgi:hypothetical protein
MLTTLGRQLRAWLRNRNAPVAPQPPPLPREVLIELDDDAWEEDPEADRQAWEAAFRFEAKPRDLD